MWMDVVDAQIAVVGDESNVRPLSKVILKKGSDHALLYLEDTVGSASCIISSTGSGGAMGK